MVTNKELILEEIKNSTNGLDTLYLSNKFSIARSNVSSILNKLVNENKIIKNDGRPVKYQIKEHGKLSFENLVGYDNSLKNAVQIAKAAIMYPEKSLNIFITGPSGSGKSYFSKLIYEFAKENNIKNAKDSYIKFNCKNYIDENSEMEKDLFLLLETKTGILFLDNVDYMNAKIRNEVFSYIEKKNNLTLICASNDNINRTIIESFEHQIPIKIELPSLNNRLLEERFSLIQKFFNEESLRIKKNLIINSELLRCLLLYDCLQNVKQLKNDIQLGCANAFVREFQTNKQELEVYVSDAPHYVRKGFLKYKNNREIVENIIPNNYSYSFSGTASTFNSKIETNIYEMMNLKIKELSNRGISEEEIGLLLSIEVENNFNNYRHKLSENIVNKDQISKIVDEKILNLVEDFLNLASLKFNVVYPASVYYGLSLHLNTSLKNNKKQTLSNEQINEIAKEHKDEYLFSLTFVEKIYKELKIKLPIDEVVLITMFICSYETKSKNASLLIAMHGESVAKEIAKVINSLVKCDNAHSFDLNLEKNQEDIYFELKEQILNINQGSGIIVIYDMGSIKNMVELIAEEYNIYIKLIQIPLTLIGLECSRKIAMGENIDSIVNGLNFESTIKKQQAIITLCSTGIGGAIEIKNYLEKNIDFQDVVIINKSFVNIKNEITELLKMYEIKCYISSQKLDLYNIPFIPISTVFNNNPQNLENLLFLQHKKNNDIDYDEIYEYLDEHLELVDINIIKKTLPILMENINKLTPLSIDQELGLFVHIASSINRILLKTQMPKNMQKEIILKKYSSLFKELLKIIKPIEKSFQIIFSDDEFANIISIIKKV